MRKRTWLLPVVVVLIFVAGAFVARRHAAQPLAGTDLGGTPAPTFRLTDQTGRPVALEDLRGKAVALTFLYTNCPDVCPLTTQKFRQAIDQLGPDAKNVAFVAITVDPETDTPARLAQYSQAMDMTGRWHFLTGSRTELAPVWKSYYVQPLSEEAAEQVARGGQAPDAGHNAPVFVIDPQGREQRLFGPDFATGDLVRDLRTLAR